MNQFDTKKELLDLISRMMVRYYVSDVVSFFALVRTIIEDMNKQSEFKILWFYCNWTLHPELNKGDADSHRFLFYTIAEAMNHHYGNEEKIIREISHAVGLVRLKTQIFNFIELIFLDIDKAKTKLLLSNTFLGNICTCVKDRPVFNNAEKTRYGVLNIVNNLGGEVFVSKVKLVEINGEANLHIYLAPSPPKLQDGLPFLISKIVDPEKS